MKLPKIAFLSNSRWQNRKERPNRSTNNRDMTKIAKHPVRDGVSLWHKREAEVLKIGSKFVECKGKKNGQMDW